MNLPPIPASMPARPPSGPNGPGQKTALPDDPLREAARALEAGFLAEMMKAAGLHDTRGAFGGGVGESQFASFLLQAQAEEMVKAGGIGLADRLWDSLKEGRG